MPCRSTARPPETPGSQRAARSRSRSEASKGSAADRSGWRRRRPRAVDPEQSALGDRAHPARFRGARATARQPRLAAPSSGTCANLRPRRSWTSISPAARRTPPDRDPQRAAEQLRIGELLAGPGVAVVVERSQPELLELVVAGARRRRSSLSDLPEDDELDIERSHRAGPGDALSRRRYCSTAAAAARAGSEAVGAHPDQLRPAVLVEVASLRAAPSSASRA